MISRRSILALPIGAACGRKKADGFNGYAFVANQEGHAIAAVDLEAMAVARHIPLDGAPAQVITLQSRPFVYALTPETGTIHEIDADRLTFNRKLTAAQSAIKIEMTPDGRSLLMLSGEPRSLILIDLASFRVTAKIPLPDLPVDFAIAPERRGAAKEITAAISLGSSVRLVSPGAGHLSDPVAEGSFTAVRFLSDGHTLVAANPAERLLSLYQTTSAKLIANLPLAVRPDHLCFNLDGGQLFITGEGADAVVVVYPYHTPEVAETVLAGHAPGAMSASQSFLFITNPQAGQVSILDILSRRVIAVVSVGGDPGFVAVTPDDQYALVLNRRSGDVAVLRVSTIRHQWDQTVTKYAALFTVIPVGSRPVQAVVRGV